MRRWEHWRKSVRSSGIIQNSWFDNLGESVDTMHSKPPGYVEMTEDVGKTIWALQFMRDQGDILRLNCLYLRHLYTNKSLPLGKALSVLGWDKDKFLVKLDEGYSDVATTRELHHNRLS